MTELELLSAVVRPALAQVFAIDDQRTIWTPCTLKELANEEETWAEEDLDFKHLAWLLNCQFRERSMGIKIDAKELDREMTVAELNSAIWLKLRQVETPALQVVVVS